MKEVENLSRKRKHSRRENLQHEQELSQLQFWFVFDYGTTELLIKDNLILFVNLLQSFLHSQMDSVQEEIGNNGSDICSGRLYPLHIATSQQTNKDENSTVIIIVIIITIIFINDVPPHC